MTHTVTIEGKLGEQQIHAAAEAARAAGCTHYAIEQAFPGDSARRWIAARGQAAAPLSREQGRGESGGNPIDNEGF